jgi:hypothetical protein
MTLANSRGGVNQMWILKNSKDLLEYIQSRFPSSCNSIKHLTSLPSAQLFLTLSWRELVQLYLIKKNGQRRYKYLVLGKDKSYFVKKNHSDSTKKFSETDIINMLEFLIENIFVIFGGGVFQQTVGIPMGTKCAPILADLFLYRMRQTSYRGFSRKTKRS